MKPYYQDEWVTIYHGDCREILPQLPKVDLVLTDPPYGISSVYWDTAIDVKEFWQLFGGQRSLVFSSQPFTSELVMANKDNYKYEIVWVKNRGSNFVNANKMPMREHETIQIFGDGIYNPQMITRAGSGADRVGYRFGKIRKTGEHFKELINSKTSRTELRLPGSVFYCETVSNPDHPTQKPIPLVEWLIQTYSISSDLIFDPFLGSGTTAYCAKKLNRKCIGIEIEEKYCEIAANRCRQDVMRLNL